MSRARISFALLWLIATIQTTAQTHICFSPPLPPNFIPNQFNEEARGGNAYSVPFDTILFNSTLATNAFDIVVCFDGVTNANEIAQADKYVDSMIARLQTVAHYNHRYKYFNVYRIAKLSNEAGAAWGFYGDTTVDNRYGSHFNAFTLERLLVPEKVDTFFADVTEFVPEYDIALNLVFDKKYGGSGYSLYDGRKVASFSIEEESGWHLSDEVIIHEMQHIMPYANHGYLGDEYEDSVACLIYDSIPRSPNFTSDTSNLRKWQHCESIPGVGFFPKAGICTGNYKPTTSCAMASVYNMPPFCPVCRENSTAYFDSVINPIYYSTPNPSSFTGSYSYSVSIDTPLVNTFRYQWYLDNVTAAFGVTTFSLNFDTLSSNTNHRLKFVCTDVDPHIVDTTLRKPWVVEWTMQTIDTSVGVKSLNETVEIKVLPNPVLGMAMVKVTGNLYRCTLSVTSIDGKEIVAPLTVSHNSNIINTENWLPGVYFVRLQRGGEQIVARFLKL